jgi:hypothetical protein
MSWATAGLLREDVEHTVRAIHVGHHAMTYCPNQRLPHSLHHTAGSCESGQLFGLRVGCGPAVLRFLEVEAGVLHLTITHLRPSKPEKVAR